MISLIPMRRNPISFFLSLMFVGIIHFGSTGGLRSDERPNILFLLVDDLGWADIGANGSTYYLTPNIDTLAANGLRFTQAYAAGSVCSPTRASIMTGRHPVRVNITDWIPGSSASRYPGHRFQQVEDLNELPLSEVTIAEVLRHNGYATFFAGKWHLGSEGFLPTDQGFDINIGGHHRGSPPGGYYAPWTNPYLKAKKDGEYLTERLTEETIAFMEKRDRDKPFLAYLSYYNVHTPIQPYRKEVEKFEKRREEIYGETRSEPISERDAKSLSRQENAAYASMVAAVDNSVGQLIDALDRLNLSDSTMVFFFSDNGGLSTKRNPGPTSNLPLRSGKGWLYEGGIREPMIVAGPSISQPGAVCHDVVNSNDFFPTILELTGSEYPQMPDIDGKSLVPLLQGASALPPRDTFWHYPHYHGSLWRPGSAIRSGHWKLIEFYEYDQVELYDLARDMGELKNLATQFPEITQTLRKSLRNWQNDMNAQMPQPVN